MELQSSYQVTELNLVSAQPQVSQVTEDITSEELGNLQAYDRDQIIELAGNDMDVLAGLVIGEVATHPYPPVFLAIWQLLTSKALTITLREYIQLAIGLPRGIGKTTVIKLFIFFLIVYTKKKYIMITAANQTKADTILADVRRLFSHPNVVALFGNVLYKCETDRSDLLIFNFKGRLITIHCLGSGGDPRGSNKGFSRPDVILSDDIQSRENAHSPTQAKTLHDWYHATLMPAKSELGCLFVYIGNMFATDDCLLKQFRDSHDWISFIAGALLADGQSIWEDFLPTEYIYKELNKAIRNNTTHIFFSEVLNDSAASGNIIFNAAKVKLLEGERLKLVKSDVEGENTFSLTSPDTNVYASHAYQAAFIIIDPAGRKKNSNDTAIGVGVVVDGIPYLREYISKVMTPLETITTALEFAMLYGCSAIVAEAYAYQESLLFWFDYVCKLYGILGFTFLPITKGGQSKNGAITNMFTQLQNGEVGMYKYLFAEILTYILRFNPLSNTNKDDVLDLLVYLPIVQLRYPSEISNLLINTIAHEVTSEVISADQNCAV